MEIGPRAAPVLAMAQNQSEVVQHIADTAARDIWEIHYPNVKQARTEYPGVTYAAGDHIRIEAEGCVKTGGAGLTWKDYVSASGRNADRIYHGLVRLPGATDAMADTADGFVRLDADRRGPSGAQPRQG